jgi:6-phosphogluconolactonase (cycloisomerase 2 family)
MHPRRFILTALLCFFGFGTVASAQTTFAYTANTLAGQSGTISIYKLNTTTGALAPSGAQFPDNDPAYLASTTGGKFLVVSRVDCPTCGLETLAINLTTGALTFSHSYEQIGAVSFDGGQIATDATGETLYADGLILNPPNITGILEALKVNADGSITPVGTPFSFPNGVGDGIGPLAVDPKGRWVFALATNSTSGELLFAIPRNADGSLGATFASRIIISDQKCNTSIVASHIAIDPQGKNLFLSCNTSGLQTFNGIQVYGINQTTGALSRVDSFTTAHSFESLSVDRQGWRVFSDTEESNLIEPFDFDRNVDQVGLLNGGILYHTGSQPNGVVVDAANKFVYVTNGGSCFGIRLLNQNCTNTSSGNISGYSFNYTQGTLTALPGSPFASGAGTRSMIFVQVP